MSVPIFLDSDYQDKKKGQVRLIYWKLDIKDIDLADLCGCPEFYDPTNPKPLSSSENNLNKIKLHFFWNQLVIKGMNGIIDDNYEFNNKQDFKTLFDTVYQYKPNDYMNHYITIDHHYIWVPLKQFLKQIENPEWYERGSIFRIEEEVFINLLYNKEKMAFSSDNVELQFSTNETKAYLDFLEDLTNQPNE